MPQGNSLIVRPATERDYPVIARIQQLAPEAAQWPLGDYSGTSLLVALEEETLAGFCAWRRTAEGEAELLNIAVHPEHRRHGVGSALLSTLLSVAQGTVFLEVSALNSRALALYLKLGWEKVAVRTGYYDNGKTEGLVMKKSSW
jgi:ribosomal-protein-alanine N-acetyltransferase